MAMRGHTGADGHTGLCRAVVVGYTGLHGGLHGAMRWAVRGRYNIINPLSWLAGGGSTVWWARGTTVVYCTVVETGLPMDAGMVAEAADAIAAEPESWRGKSGAALCAPAAALVAFGSQSAGKHRGVF